MYVSSDTIVLPINVLLAWEKEHDQYRVNFFVPGRSLQDATTRAKGALLIVLGDNDYIFATTHDVLTTCDETVKLPTTEKEGRDAELPKINVNARKSARKEGQIGLVFWFSKQSPGNTSWALSRRLSKTSPGSDLYARLVAEVQREGDTSASETWGDVFDRHLPGS